MPFDVILNLPVKYKGSDISNSSYCVTNSCLLNRNGFPCNTSRLEEVPSLIAPGFRQEPPACIVQTQALLFSCTGTSPSTMRLCPCRKYKKGQVALCEECWHVVTSPPLPSSCSVSQKPGLIVGTVNYLTLNWGKKVHWTKHVLFAIWRSVFPVDEVSTITLVL